MKTAIILLAGLAGVLFAACQTVPKTIPTSLTPAEYFQTAQQAASVYDNYNAALKYYDTFIQRYPKDQSRIAEARYEIAFLHYKKGQLVEAHGLFEKLVEDYKKPTASSLPRWPLVLSNKLIIIINNDLNKNKK